MGSIFVIALIVFGAATRADARSVRVELRITTAAQIVYLGIPVTVNDCVVHVREGSDGTAVLKSAKRAGCVHSYRTEDGGVVCVGLAGLRERAHENDLLEVLYAHFMLC